MLSPDLVTDGASSSMSGGHGPSYDAAASAAGRRRLNELLAIVSTRRARDGRAGVAIGDERRTSTPRPLASRHLYTIVVSSTSTLVSLAIGPRLRLEPPKRSCAPGAPRLHDGQET